MFKWSYALMLSATVATTLSLSSCGDSAAKKAEKRTADLGFVSQLPKDTGVVLGYYNTNEMWQKMRGSALARVFWNMEESSEEDADLTKPIPVNPLEVMIQNIVGKEVVVAMTGDVAGKMKVWGELGTAGNELNISALQGEEAEKKVQARVMEIVNRLEIPTTLVALRNDSGNYDLIKTSLQAAADKVNKEKAGTAESVTHKIGNVSFEGYKVNVTSLLEEMIKSSKKSTFDAKNMEALKNKSAYLLMSRMGNNTVFVLSEKLEGITLSSSPAESLAATEEFAFMDQYEGKKPTVLAYAAKPVMDAYVAYNKDSFNSLEPMLTALINDNAGQMQINTSKFTASLQAIFKDYSEMMDCTFRDTKSVGMFGWWDKGLKVEWHGLPMAAYNMQQTLRYNGIPADPSTALYYEVNGSQEYMDISWRVFGNLGDLIINGADAALASPVMGMMAGQYKPVYETVRPSLIKMGQSVMMLGTQGIGTDSAVAVGSSDEQSPIRLALMSDVKNPDMIRQGWKGISDSANEVGTKLMAESWDMLVPTVQTTPMKVEGQEFSFSETNPLVGVPMPVTFASALSDKNLAYGVGSSYVRSLLPVAIKPSAVPYKGFSYYVNFSALTKGISSLMGEDAIEVAPVLDAVNQDMKSIDGGIIEREGKPIFTFYLRTE